MTPPMNAPYAGQPVDRSLQWQAALLSIVMHGVLLLAMVLMVDWKAAHVTPAVMEATLWDRLPAPQPPATLPPAPMPESSSVQPSVKAPAEPVQESPAPAADIMLKKQPKSLPDPEEAKRKEEQKKQEQLKKLQQELRSQAHDEQLKQIQAQARQQDLKPAHEPVAAAATEADPSVLARYVQIMSSKIRSNVIQTLCPASNPELIIEMKLTPSGDIAGMPKLIKGSGDSVCDDAVVRAILASKPFDLPTDDAATRSKLLDLLRLKLRPRAS